MKGTRNIGDKMVLKNRITASIPEMKYIANEILADVFIPNEDA